LGSGEASVKEQVQTNPATEPKRSQNPKRPLPSSVQPDGHRISLDAPERPKQDGGHAERGFLGTGEASVKEQVQSNPVTEPKRSQNPKGPLPSSSQPDGHRIALDAPERSKQDGGHAERGSLGSGEALAKEQVQTNPATEPKRSQNPKGPLPSSSQPDGHRIALDALNQINSGIALTDVTREKWQLVEDSWFKPILYQPAKANFQTCFDNTRQLLQEITALSDQLQPLTTGADRSAADPWLAIVAALRRMLDALTAMDGQFPRVIFSDRIPVPMLRKDVADAKAVIVTNLKQLREAAHEARNSLQQHLAKLAPVTPPAPAAAPTRPLRPNPVPRQSNPWSA
jgi:hypothetical protein